MFQSTIGMQWHIYKESELFLLIVHVPFLSNNPLPIYNMLNNNNFGVAHSSADDQYFHVKNIPIKRL